MSKIVLSISLIAIFIMFINCSYAKSKPQDLQTGIKLFLTKQITTQHKTVDPATIDITLLNTDNLNDKICTQDTNYYFPIYANTYGKTIVVAECNQPKNPWKIYIPISMKFFVEAVSVKKSLPKLHIINPEDLIAKKIKVMTLKVPYIENGTDVVGLKLKNSVKQDTVLTMNLLEKVQNGA